MALLCLIAEAVTQQLEGLILGSKWKQVERCAQAGTRSVPRSLPKDFTKHLWQLRDEKTSGIIFLKYFLYISPWLKVFSPLHTQKKAKRTFWSVHNRWAAHEKGDRGAFCSLPTQTKHSPSMQADHEHSCSLGSAERRASRTSHEDWKTTFSKQILRESLITIEWVYFERHTSYK